MLSSESTVRPVTPPDVEEDRTLFDIKNKLDVLEDGQWTAQDLLEWWSAIPYMAVAALCHTFSRAASQTLAHTHDALPEHAALPFLSPDFQYLLDACTISSIDRLCTK
jgi:hypothetical protein